MPEQVLKNVGIWIDGRDFAGVSNSVGLSLEAEAPESTTFADDWRTRSEGGLLTSGLTLEGWYDRGDIDAAQFASLGVDGQAMIAPAGQDAGDLAYVVPYTASAFEPGASVGELMAFTFAGEGDGQPHRGQVMDVRSGIDADADQPRQNFGAIPVGHARRVVLHVDVESGEIDIALASATAETGGTITGRGRVDGITATGLHVIDVQSVMASPVTDNWWFLEYRVTGATDVDVAAATLQGEHQSIIPPTPIVPPVVTADSFRGGLSSDATPSAAELTITTTTHRVALPAFINMHILIARLASEADITSAVLDSDATMQNQIAGFTKFATPVTVAGNAYNVWVSNQSLTFPNPDTFILS